MGSEMCIRDRLNTVYVNDKTVPTIVSSSLDAYNTTITVTFSEAVFATNSTSGILTTGDFTLAISGGTATLPGNSPTSISGGNGPVFELGFSLSGMANGSEVITVSVEESSIFDATGLGASTTQSNNTVTLNGTKIAQVAALEQDNDFGKTPSFAHVSGNVYVMAYQGPGNRGSVSYTHLTLPTKA